MPNITRVEKNFKLKYAVQKLKFICLKMKRVNVKFVLIYERWKQREASAFDIICRSITHYAYNTDCVYKVRVFS